MTHMPEKTYKIIRFHFQGENHVIERGLSLAEAQAHCNREDTHGEGWFDGYDEEEAETTSVLDRAASVILDVLDEFGLSVAQHPGYTAQEVARALAEEGLLIMDPLSDEDEDVWDFVRPDDPQPDEKGQS